MNLRCAAALLTLAGLPIAAAAQESISYVFSWIEVNANTAVPVANPNGQLDPGEGVRLRLNLTVTPGIGSPATFVPPPAPGSGTIAGLGSAFFDLLQTNAQGGTWSNFTRTPGFNIGGAASQGTPNLDGSLSAVQVGQFVLPGQFANSTNPLNNVWQATWNPSNYTIRNITFQAVPALASGGNHSSILIQYGPDPENDPQYVAKFVGADFGSIVIPVMPTPSSLTLLGLAGLAAAHRRR